MRIAYSVIPGWRGRKGSHNGVKKSAREAPRSRMHRTTMALTHIPGIQPARMAGPRSRKPGCSSSKGNQRTATSGAACMRNIQCECGMMGGNVGSAGANGVNANGKRQTSLNVMSEYVRRKQSAIDSEPTDWQTTHHLTPREPEPRT